MPGDSQEATELQLARAAAELGRARDKLVLSMGAVEHEVARKLDWRAWVRRRPGLLLALALAVGVLLGRRD
jgi:hypothetical protein